MSQYRTGTVAVTNGNAIVTGTGTLFLANVTVGSVFCIQGSGVPYIVGAVNSNTQITLTSPYAGTTESGKSYSITTSFTPNQQLAYPEFGDIDTAAVLKRAMLDIDTLLGNALGAAAQANRIVYTDASGNLKTSSGLVFNESTGAVGIAVTPEAWHSSGRVLRIGVGGALQGHTTDERAAFMSNAYEAASDGFWKYITTQGAAQISLDNGTIIFNAAASGAAGANITWKEAARITPTSVTLGSVVTDAHTVNGTLSIGAALVKSAGIIQITGAAGSVDATASGVELRGGATPSLTAYNRGGAAYIGMVYDALNHQVQVSGAEIARVTSTGLGVFCTPDLSGFQTKKSGAGVALYNTVQNTSNTAGSDALFVAEVAGTSAGDPFTLYNVIGGSAWTSGVDNSDSDSFKISQSTGVGTNGFLKIDSSGHVLANDDKIIGWGASTYGFMGNSSSGTIRTFIAGGEKSRTTADGYFKASNDGSYYSVAGATHELISSINDTARPVLIVSRTAANAVNQNGIYINLQGDPNSTGTYFWKGVGTDTTERITARSNGGIANFQANDVNLSDEMRKLIFGPAVDYSSFVETLQFKEYMLADGIGRGKLLGVSAQDLLQQDDGECLVTNFDSLSLGVYEHQLQQRINSVVPGVLRRLRRLEDAMPQGLLR